MYRAAVTLKFLKSFLFHAYNLLSLYERKNRTVVEQHPIKLDVALCTLMLMNCMLHSRDKLEKVIYEILKTIHANV